MSTTELKGPTATVDALIRYADSLGFEGIHIKFDPSTNMTAIIAVHNIKHGPAIGGCRFISYRHYSDALYDAIRLANGMTMKALMAGLPHGGAKSVLIRPDHITDRTQLFSTFGKFVDELSGKYITAMDSGTTPKDMDDIARSTPYVLSRSRPDGSTHDPSPYTARGVLRAIEAAASWKLGKTALKDLHVAIQGLGNVGYSLAKLLHEQGARLTVYDINPAAVDLCVKELSATAATEEQIYQIPCDIFAPCALGAVLNDKTIPMLQTKIIAGCANNQLAEPRHGDLLQSRDILYSPDYVANAGGLIYAATEYSKANESQALMKIDGIKQTLLKIFEGAEQAKISTAKYTDDLARSLI